MYCPEIDMERGGLTMADILIRGMEMPKNCEDCRLSYSDEYGTTICAACDDCAYSVSCPLVPLPEGHGRLIDADALDRAFTDLRFNSDGTLNHWGDRPGWCMHGYEVEKLIADAHTIVPAEGGTDE